MWDCLTFLCKKNTSLFILWKFIQEVVSPNRSVYHGFLCPFFLTSLRCVSGFIMHEIHDRHRSFVVEEQLPFPEVAPVCFGLKQTSRPRKWFLKIVSGPYPFCTEWSKNVINTISNLFLKFFIGFFSCIPLNMSTLNTFSTKASFVADKFYECVWTLTSSSTWLDYLSILVVLLSCVNDGMYQPCVEAKEESFTREVIIMSWASEEETSRLEVLITVQKKLCIFIFIIFGWRF